MEIEKSFLESDHSEEPETDLDHLEYGKILDYNFRKIVLAEEHFAKVKRILWEKRLEQIAQKKNEVSNSTSGEIKARNVEAYEEFEHMNKLAETYKVLESDSLFRQIQGMRAVVQTSQDDNIILAQERLIDSISSQIANLEDIMTSAQLMRRKLHEFRDFSLKKEESVDDECFDEESSFISSEDDCSSSTFSSGSDASSTTAAMDCATEEESHTGSESGTPDFPVVTYQLRESDIISDLEFFELAIRKADIGDSLQSPENLTNSDCNSFDMQI